MSSQLIFRAATTVCSLLLNAGAMTAARAEPIIFVVSYHNVDYAKAGCELVQTQAPEARRIMRQYGNNPDFQPAEWAYSIVNAANICRLSTRPTRAWAKA
jgi:hypothetical protein